MDGGKRIDIFLQKETSSRAIHGRVVGLGEDVKKEETKDGDS